MGTPKAAGQHAEEDEGDPGRDLAGHDDGQEGANGHDPARQQRYDHAHDEAEALALSQQARANIGVRLSKLELRPFERTITVPGLVVERPGWSTIEVTAPMTGTVTRIYPIRGEAVRPGQPLFEVRLTHEDLLEKQTAFLLTVEELDVVVREVARLEKAAGEGAIAGKTLLERKYERQKKEAALRAQREALLLHGLTREQVERIETARTLLQSLTVFAPARTNGEAAAAGTKTYQVQEMKASQGTYVTAGATLCRLIDAAELYIEGKAFEQDMQAIHRAAAKGWKVAAHPGRKAESGEDAIRGLKILFVDDKVDADSRVFHFYAALPNRVTREDATPDGRRFVYWQHKPGQRVQIRVPVETWTDRIVLPLEAVAQDGANFYVFEANGDHFDRRPVHVEYRDQDWVVIANDGALKVGAMVAASAAHQMQLALKNKAGGGVDPHAGHNH